MSDGADVKRRKFSWPWRKILLWVVILIIVRFVLRAALG